jgi:hypothetical protein
VLIVAPDEQVLRAAARAVAERYDAAFATSGEEALAIVSEGGVHAVVVDQRLPDVSAGLFLDEAHRRCPDLSGRIIFVTQNGRSVPPCGHTLERPLRRAPLLAALTAVIDRPTLTSVRPLRQLN